MRESIPFSKRWHRRAQSWVPHRDVQDMSILSVDVVPEKIAKPFITEHHYSGSYPAARLAVGLFKDKSLEGVAVFSVPMNQNAIPAYTGLAPSEGVELGRFVCTPNVAYNTETWFLARAFRLLGMEKPGIEAVLSYADPMERRCGEIVVKPAHYGQIYAASNAVYAGKANGRTMIISASGRIMSERAISKIRNQESGHEYAERLFVTLGAEQRRIGEAPGDWISRMIDGVRFRRERHSGNLAFVFGLGRRTSRNLRERYPGHRAYPKPPAYLTAA